jgi:outer membrane protein assembly factor BamD (BamD/ComL family)
MVLRVTTSSPKSKAPDSSNTAPPSSDMSKAGRVKSNLGRDDEVRRSDRPVSKKRTGASGLSPQKDNQEKKGLSRFSSLKSFFRIKEIKKQLDSKVLGEDLTKDASSQRYDFKRLSKIFAIFMAVFCLVFLGYLAKLFFDGAEAERGFNQLQQMVAKAKNMEQQQLLYRNFVTQNPNSKHVLEVNKKLEEFPALIDNRDFAQAERGAKNTGDRYEEAEEFYLKYLERHPNGKHVETARKAIAALPKRIDDRDFNRVIENYEALKDQPDKAEQTLLEYVNAHKEGAHRDEIQALLGDIPSLKEDLHYREILKELEDLGDKYEKWKPVLNKYLEDYPMGGHTQEALALIQQIPEKIDDRDYKEALKAEEFPFEDRESKFSVYLKTHPNGRHVEQIKQQIAQIPIAWATHLKESMSKLSEEGKWEEAIAQCKAYLNKYPAAADSDEMGDQIKDFQAKIRGLVDEKDYQKASAVEKAAGVTPEQAKQAYEEYLKEHPSGEYKAKAEENIRRLDGLIVAATWRSLKRKAEAPDKNTSAVLDEVKAFLKLHPESELVAEGEKLVERLSAQLHTELESSVWQRTAERVRSARTVRKALNVLQKFLVEYPQGKYAGQARQEIVSLEMRRYQALAPFPESQALCSVEIKGKDNAKGYTLTGVLHERDANTYLLTDQNNIPYYINKAEIAGMHWSPEAQYNNLIIQKKPHTAADFLELASWSEKAGFRDKALINLVMAAYLDPDNGQIAQQLERNGFSYKNCRWRSKSIW